MFKLKMTLLMVLVFVFALVSPVSAAVSNFDLLNEDTDSTFEHTEGRIWVDACNVRVQGGTWTCTAGTNLMFLRLTAADATVDLIVPLHVIGQTTSGKGYKITAIRIFYDWDVVGSIGITPAIYLLTMPATGAQTTGTAPAFTYDTSHDVYLERITADEHTMVLTITSPVWNTAAGTHNQLRLTVDGNGTSVLDFYGVEIDFTFNML